MLIWRWQRLSRIVDYYHLRLKKYKSSFVDKIMYFFYVCRFHRMSVFLGIEMCTENIGAGLQIYHYSGGVVVNGDAIIGKNSRFHGNNCVGNGGLGKLSCPVIGDDVVFGVGAKVIGGVRVASGVKIAAGAVVVHDILEEGCTVAGVPAKIVKHRNDVYA